MAFSVAGVGMLVAVRVGVGAPLSSRATVGVRVGVAVVEMLVGVRVGVAVVETLVGVRVGVAVVETPVGGVDSP